MSRTRGHNQRAAAGHPCKEHWKSRLRRWGDELGKWTKQQTAKKERRRDRGICAGDERSERRGFQK